MSRYENLKGPFSPFTLALLNIRGKLLADLTTKGPNGDDIDVYYLEQIISLTIPISDSQNTNVALIQFPFAACNRDGNVMIRYAGQFDRSNIEKDDLHDALYKFVAKWTKNCEERIDCLDINDIIGESQNLNPINFPQNLRKICGFFNAFSDDAQFYIAVSCTPVDESMCCCMKTTYEGATICPVPENLTLNLKKNNILECCLRDTVKVFREYFLFANYRGILSGLLRAPDSSENPSINNLDQGLSEGYPILRETLSKIQDEALELVSNIEADDQKRAFSLAFVMPNLNDSNELCFKYILTNKQIDALLNVTTDKLSKIIEEKKENSFKMLKEEVQRLPLETSDDSLQNFENITELLSEHIEIDENRQVVPKESNMQLEECLRNSIFLHYTFRSHVQNSILEELEKTKGLAGYMQSDDAAIKYTHTFLIDQIFKYKHPDLMTSMINHPLSKIKQFNTLEMIDNYKSNYQKNKTFYPAELNLIEYLFLPSSLYLYPVYMLNVPLMLCAFDANFFAGHWQSLKIAFETHKHGFLSQIVGHEIDKTKKLFDENKDIAELNKDKSARFFAERLSQLALRLCPELDSINNMAYRPIIEKGDAPKNLKKIIPPTLGKDGEIWIPQFGQKVVLKKEIANPYESANHYWKHYIKMILDAFSGAWNNAMHATEKQEAAVAIAAGITKERDFEFVAHELGNSAMRLESGLKKCTCELPSYCTSLIKNAKMLCSAFRKMPRERGLEDIEYTRKLQSASISDRSAKNRDDIFKSLWTFSAQKAFGDAWPSGITSYEVYDHELYDFAKATCQIQWAENFDNDFHSLTTKNPYKALMRLLSEVLIVCAASNTIKHYLSTFSHKDGGWLVEMSKDARTVAEKIKPLELSQTFLIEINKKILKIRNIGLYHPKKRILQHEGTRVVLEHVLTHSVWEMEPGKVIFFDWCNESSPIAKTGEFQLRYFITKILLPGMFWR